MISFKGSQFPKDVILFAYYFYVRYSVSHRDLEEKMAERGVVVDHATLNRWVTKFALLIALGHGSVISYALRLAMLWRLSVEGFKELSALTHPVFFRMAVHYRVPQVTTVLTIKVCFLAKS